MSICEVFCSAFGRVQNVMFRQTIVRGAIKRGLECGVTNDKENMRKVSISLKGQKEKIDEFLNELKSGKELNSWGAYVDTINIDANGIHPFQHEVNTQNVDQFRWNQNIDFYI